MSEKYHQAQRDFQDRFDTRRLADRLGEGTVPLISPHHRAFIEAREMFIIATADDQGRPEASYKGGKAGFVRVLDDRTLAFPVYNGNGMYKTAGNLAVNPNVGLLFIDLEGGTRLRLNGTAEIEMHGELVESYPGAEFVVRVTATEVFPNCRRYVHRYRLVDESPFVPSLEGEAPVPDWKLDPWFEGTLPAHDPAHDPDHPRAPSLPQF